MAGIFVRGNVFHLPGIWGAIQPAKGAKVIIYDKDKVGGDDKILETTTDHNGNFQGNTNNWNEGVKTIPRPFPLPPIVDVDALILAVRVEHLGKTKDFFPVVYDPITGRINPIGLDFGPSAFIFVNGQPTYNPADIAPLGIQSIIQNQPLEIKITGPDAAALSAFTNLNQTQLIQIIRQKTGMALSDVEKIIQATQLNPLGWVEVSIIAIIVCAVVAVAISFALLAVVVYAISKDRDVEVEQSTEATPAGPIVIWKLKVT